MNIGVIVEKRYRIQEMPGAMIRALEARGVKADTICSQGGRFDPETGIFISEEGERFDLNRYDVLVSRNRNGLGLAMLSYGVDAIETPSGLAVIEVNDFPNFTGVPGAADAIADYVLARFDGESGLMGASVFPRTATTSYTTHASTSSPMIADINARLAGKGRPADVRRLRNGGLTMKVCFLLERDSPSSLKTILSRTFTLLEECGVRVQAFSPEVCRAPARNPASPKETWPAPIRTSRSLLLAKTFSAYAIPLLLTDSCGPMDLQELTGDCSGWSYDA